MLQEGPETDIQIVCNNMRVVLDIRPHDPLPGRIVTRNVLGEPWEVPLQVVPLHVRAAKSDEDRRRGLREEPRVRLEVGPMVPPEQASARDDGPIADNLR